MKKQLFLLCLAFIASIGTISAEIIEHVQIGDLYYNLNADDQTAEVTYQSSWSSDNYAGLTSVTIPFSVEYNSVTYSVTSIGNSAFHDCTSLISVEIPNSVTSIGELAFCRCTGLNSVNIPNSVTSIGELAFCRCTGLNSVNIPNSVTSIGRSAFNSCTGLTSVDIPNSVTSIGEYAFGDVNNIVYFGSATGSPWGAKSVNGYVEGYLVYSDETKTTLLGCSSAASGEIVIPNSVTSIGERAFYNCSGLTSVTIPNSVTSIGEDVFYGCTGLTTPVYNAHIFIYMPTSYVGACTIPDGIETIANYAFYSCTGMTSVEIPNSVTDIGEWAFLSCKNLTSINVAVENPVYCSLDGILFNKDKTKLIQCPEGEQGEYTIPNSVSVIGRHAFTACSGLTLVTIPNSVTNIEWRAFFSCEQLTIIEIPNSVTSIGGEAFYGCKSLTSVTIGNGVTSIGEWAFSGCRKLTSITCNAVTPPTLGSSVFDYVDKSIPVIVPEESVVAYQAADGWKDFTNIQAITDEPFSIGETTYNQSQITNKIIKNNQIYILTGDKTYTITGQQVK